MKGISRPKKLIICFSGTTRFHFQSPRIKHFHCISTNKCEKNSAPLIKCQKFSQNIIRTSFLFPKGKKIKTKSRPPTSFSEKSAQETYY